MKGRGLGKGGGKAPSLFILLPLEYFMGGVVE